MWILFLVLLALVAGAWADHMYSAKAIKKVKAERDLLKTNIEKVANLPVGEFNEWKTRFAAAKRALEAKR